ncbi:hypothetical protein E3N88_38848 [Mikania micrantha]|uniref:Uncharacterized protein n=1 Tax=Mikania micrantha TaxID=192012 RepID=A0A5N6LV97_9ASTR|nr:hypothetical protein E3N88_38848 [Mikania micrantha]
MAIQIRENHVKPHLSRHYIDLSPSTTSYTESFVAYRLGSSFNVDFLKFVPGFICLFHLFIFFEGLIADIDIESEQYRWMGSAQMDIYVRLIADIDIESEQYRWMGSARMDIYILSLSSIDGWEVLEWISVSIHGSKAYHRESYGKSVHVFSFAFIVHEVSYRFMAPEAYHRESYGKSVHVFFFALIVHEDYCIARMSITCNRVHVYSSEKDYTLFTPPPPSLSVETLSPIKGSSDTMEEVMASNDEDIEENYESNLKELPRSLG